LLCRLLLLSGRLATDLALGLVEQATRLSAGLSGDLPGLLRRGLGDLATRLAGMLGDVRRLIANGVAGGRLGRNFFGARPVGL
jgi:uncharacterized pyridoxal phosphate-containing UPF0001 family protein